MSWKTAYRSFYYANAEEPEDIVLDPAKDGPSGHRHPEHLSGRDKDTPEETARWQPFFDRMRGTVIPNTKKLIEACRAKGVEIIFARIACHKDDGRDRSLSQKKPGFNYLLLPKDEEDGRIVPELEPKAPDDIVIIKTTDSALTGTNLRLMLRNMEIERTSSSPASSPISAYHRRCAAWRMKASMWCWSRNAVRRLPWSCTRPSFGSST